MLTVNCYAADFEPLDFDAIDSRILRNKESAVVYLSNDDHWNVWVNGSLVGSVSTQADAESTLREHVPADARIMYTNGMPDRRGVMMLKSVRPAAGHSSASIGELCFVGPGWLIIPAARYPRTPLEEIDKLELERDRFLGINLAKGFMSLECESESDRDDLAYAISTLAGVNVWNGMERVSFANRR